jgi:hypothetical protein
VGDGVHLAEVREELIAQTLTLGGALDQPDEFACDPTCVDRQRLGTARGREKASRAHEQRQEAAIGREVSSGGGNEPAPAAGRSPRRSRWTIISRIHQTSSFQWLRVKSLVRYDAICLNYFDE